MFDYEIGEINEDIKTYKRVKYDDTRPKKDPYGVSNSNSSFEIQQD